MSASLSVRECRWTYAGEIAGHRVEGCFVLPEDQDDVNAFLRTLFCDLAQRSGVPIELMEGNSCVLWHRERL